MFAQFILPLQHENHPAFSQSKIKGIMTSLPPKFNLIPHSTCPLYKHAYFISNMLIQ